MFRSELLSSHDDSAQLSILYALVSAAAELEARHRCFKQKPGSCCFFFTCSEIKSNNVLILHLTILLLLQIYSSLSLNQEIFRKLYLNTNLFHINEIIIKNPNLRLIQGMGGLFYHFKLLNFIYTETHKLL